MATPNKRLFTIFAIATGILLLPFVGMQFPDSGVNWSIFDFIVAAVLLFGTGLAIELVLRKVKTKKARIALSITLLAILVLVWAELAVGVFGTPFAGS